MKTLQKLLFVIILFRLSTTGFSQELTGLQIMQKFEEQDKTKDTEAKIKMILVNKKGNERERELIIWSNTDKENKYKQLIKILSPSDIAGTGFLTVESIKNDEDNWLYLPALRKTRRIVGSDKTGYFIGSDFTYEDLSSEDLIDFKYKYLEDKTINGITTWKVEAIAKSKSKLRETGYSKRVVWIDKKTHLVVKVSFYDKEGTNVKLLTTGDIRTTSSGKFRPFSITMENLEKGSKTILKFSYIKINEGIADETFSIRKLQQR